MDDSNLKISFVSLSLDMSTYFLTLKVPNKNCSRQHFNFYCYLWKKIKLDFSVESIHLKHQVLFSLKKNNEKIYMNVVCCSRDWRFKG